MVVFHFPSAYKIFMAPVLCFGIYNGRSLIFENKNNYGNSIVFFTEKNVS